MRTTPIRTLVLSGAASLALSPLALNCQQPPTPAGSEPASQASPKPGTATPKARRASQGHKAGASLVPQGARARRKPPTTEQLKQRYEEALKSPFIAKGHWVLDYDEARARAKREGKLIFAYFSRSYAP